ncbi:MAG: DUF4340 domain-containing protein [Nitrospirota bacterium]
MSFFKKTIFWIIILAAIGGAFLVFTKEEEKIEIRREEEKSLLRFEPEDISSFAIKRGDIIIECQDGSNGWHITKPVKADGDKDAFDRFFRMVVKAKFDGVLFEEHQKEKLAEFGLEKPYLEIEFKLKNNKKPVTLYFGDRGPTQNIAFAMVSDDKRFFRLHSDIRAEADKDAYALRDKTILLIDPIKARGVAIIRPEGKIVMEQPIQGRWDFTEPEGSGIVNVAKLMELLYKVKSSKAKAFIEEDPKDLKKYGLDNPKIKLNVWSGGKNPPEVLLIGGRDKALRGYYAKRELVANVFLLEEDFIDILPKAAKEMAE